MYPETEADNSSLSFVTNMVREVFCDSDRARYGPYELLGEGTEALVDTLYEFPIYDDNGYYTLHVYKGIHDSGGRFWEQEIRTLMRMARMGHPALPDVIGGGYDEWGGEDFAHFRTYRPEATLKDPGEMEYFRNNKLEALWQLGTLADALTTLHMHSIQHRNLWHDTVERFQPQQGGRKRSLRLVRFEMSSFLANLFRRVNEAENEAGLERTREAIQRLVVAQGNLALSCCSPERLRVLAAGQDAKRPDARLTDLVQTSSSDVFSLGVIASQWFADAPPDEDLVSRIYDGGLINADAADAFLRALHRSLDKSERLPKDLRDLLKGMTAPDWRDRLGADKVCTEVSRKFESWSLAWREETSTEPRLLGFLTGEIGQNIYHNWEWVKHDPSTREGKIEAADLIEEDVFQGHLVYSPEGYAPFCSVSITKPMSRAKYVILGQRAAWFCELYRQDSTDERWKELLLIKYVAERDRSSRDKVSQLYANPFRQGVGTVQVEPVEFGSNRRLNDMRCGRPDWTPLLTASEHHRQRPDEHLVFERALHFLLSFFQTEMEMRYYPFTSEGGIDDGMTLTYDGPRWTERVVKDSTPLLSFYANNMPPRPFFGDFFTTPTTFQEGAKEVAFLKDSGGRPGKRTLGHATVGHYKDYNEVRINITKGGAVPKKGWLVPLRDLRSRGEITRQIKAVSEITALRSLVDQLRNPLAIRTFRHPWAKAGEQIQDKTATEGTDGQHFVQELLRCEPFYALHGPPGTGKTTVVSHAIAALLEREPTARILVSAQSNFALDNLGERIISLLKEKGADPDLHRRGWERGRVLRISSEASDDKIPKAMLSHKLTHLAKDMEQEIREACIKSKEDLIENKQYKHAELVREWLARLHSNSPDLQERVRRGANVVLATCSGASKSRVSQEAGSALFDWVIIEEAAKAWPTELAIPLVRGFKWTLVGDHKQLPAHRLIEVDSFLRKCEGDDDFEIKQHGLSRKAYMSWYQLFRSLFEPEEEEEEQKPKTGTGWRPRERREERVSPLGQMNKQYRMRSPIARVISNAFYTEMPLETHPDADKRMHGLSSPNFLRGGGAIYWLDTTDLPYYDEDTNWSNEGEARLVRDFLYKLEPFPVAKVKPFGDSPLAVVSPYRAQNELIKLYLEGGGSAPGFTVSDERRRQVATLVERNRNILHTVHSIQGREADIVVASLVRTGAGGDNVNSSLGHVAQRTLINVLFSRARLLLVLVGRFDFFHRAASKFETADFWGQVCLSIPEEGKRSAEDLYVRRG